MASTQLDPLWPDAPWFRAPRAPDADDFARRDAAAAQHTRLVRRQRLVKGLGGASIAGLCVLAGWMATSTAVRDSVASWGTMGNVTQAVRLSASAPEEVASALPELDLGAGTLAWAMGPALAESSVALPAASYRAPDDPYLGAAAPAPAAAPDALSDPY